MVENFKNLFVKYVERSLKLRLNNRGIILTFLIWALPSRNELLLWFSYLMKKRLLSIFDYKNASYWKQYPSKVFSFSNQKVLFLKIARSALCLRSFKNLRLKLSSKNETTKSQTWYHRYIFKKNNIRSSRKFPTLFYFMSRSPKNFLRR